MSDYRTKHRVRTQDLRRVCKPVKLSKEELNELGLGQETALASMDLGLLMADDEYARRHYNIVVVGQPQTGRTAATLRHVRQRAEREEFQPPDAVAVHDFDSPRRFIVAYVPNGQGEQLSEALTEFAKQAAKELSDAAENYRNQRMKKLLAMQEQSFLKASEAIAPFNCVLLVDYEKGSANVRPISLQNPEDYMSEDEYDQLEPEVKAEILERTDQATKVATPIIKESTEKVNAETKKVTKNTIKWMRQQCAKRLLPIRELAGNNPEFNRYLKGLAKRASLLLARPQQSDNPFMGDAGPSNLQVLSEMCKLRVLVDNTGVTHRKVVYVGAPRFTRLFGCPHAEQISENHMRMDHTLVDGGAFLEANEGYLVFDLRAMLRLGRDPAFTKLLEVLRTGRLTIETMPTFLDLDVVHDYRSSEIPIDVRVILICTPRLEAVLRRYEPDFDNLFRVVSEFESDVPVEDAQRVYAKFARICCKSDKLPGFTPTALAKLVEYGSRRAGQQSRCSIELGWLKGKIREAAFFARQAGAKSVSAKHVRESFRKIYESQSLRIRRYQDYVDNGHLLSLTGQEVAQVNGLVVLQLSNDLMFGIPKRITARCFAGQNGILLVQRDTKQSGPSSNAAIATISGYLNGKYGRKKALSLSVQLSFEQSYGGIDGDSASLAEMIAIISAITELPVNQCGVITGSMNQLGEVQPIGGVNEKIEGHFDLLKRRQMLTGEHFAVVPQINADELMLHEELIKAERKGLYSVYAITHVDQALEIFLGKPIEEIDALVQQKLAEMQKKDKKKKKKE